MKLEKNVEIGDLTISHTCIENKNFAQFECLINLKPTEEDILLKISDSPKVKLILETEENEMKEMVYQPEFKREILYHGFYKNYEFYIMNLGTYPTAYVNVFSNNLLTIKNYNDINIEIHGGLTYSKDYLCINNKSEKVKGWFIGWDYAHIDDYTGYEEKLPEHLRTHGKKWTTQEIFEDVKDVIEQCINYKKRRKYRMGRHRRINGI